MVFMMGAPMENAGAPAPSSSQSAAESSAPSVSAVRRYFPETWIWQRVLLGSAASLLSLLLIYFVCFRILLVASRFVFLYCFLKICF